MAGFKLIHGSATREKALAAADRVEEFMGRVANGEARPTESINVEDLALLVQRVRNTKEAE